MKFQHGNDYGRGRKKGSVNKATTNVRDAFTLLVQNNLEGLQSDLDALSPRDRIKAIAELSKYVLPQLKSIEYKDGDKDNFQPIIIQYD